MMAAFCRRPAFPLLVALIMSWLVSGVLGEWHHVNVLFAIVGVLVFDRSLAHAYEAGRRAGKRDFQRAGPPPRRR